MTLLIISVSVLLILSVYNFRQLRRSKDLLRLEILTNAQQNSDLNLVEEIDVSELQSLLPIDASQEKLDLKSILSNRLNQVFLLVSFVIGGTLGFLEFDAIGIAIGSVVAIYLFLLILTLFSKVRSASEKKEVLAELPVLLESLILLVESGLGILPAIHKLLDVSGTAVKPKSARFYLQLVHELSNRGMPFAAALELVANRCPYPTLRHFFLHLDIGANVGGKLGDSLRSLAHHAHQEWKLSVEGRVRRLENLVVFPVFGSVIGLMLTTAAVPLIPLLDLKDRLDASQAASQQQNSSNSVQGQTYEK